MYLDWFGLKTAPFNNTPDPRFFLNTPDHEEALASLIYAAEQRKGYVLVTGEVGSGKTLLSRLLLGRLPAGARTAVLTNTRLSGPGLLSAICREFGIPVDKESPADYSHLLEEFLLEQYSRDRLAVVILDEAQNLPPDAFEELRLLGNLEADDAKLLQVLILGQPELSQSLHDPSLVQLQQRIFRFFHLGGLNRTLTAKYITHRLNVAADGAGPAVFDRAARDVVYDQSKGLPRLINQICDNAMLAAYGAGRRTVTAEMVRETAEQMLALPGATLDPGLAGHVAGSNGSSSSTQPSPMETAQPTGKWRSRSPAARQKTKGRLGTARRSESPTKLEETRASPSVNHSRLAELVEEVERQSAALSLQGADLLAQERQSFDDLRRDQRKALGEFRANLTTLRERVTRLDTFAQLPDLDAIRERRERMEALLADLHGAADSAREQTASFLAGLRVKANQSADAAESRWNKLFGEITAMSANLDAKSAAHQECFARTAADFDRFSDRATHQLTRLTGQLGSIQSEIDVRVNGASARLTTIVQDEVDSKLRHFSAELDKLTAESAGCGSRASEAVAEARRGTEEAERSRQRIAEQSKQVLEEADQRLAELRGGAQRAVGILNRGSAEWMKSLRDQAQRIRSDSESSAAAVLERLAGALAEARSVSGEIAAAKSSSLNELRSADEQMRGGADRLRGDLTGLAEELRLQVAESAGRLQGEVQRMEGRIALARTAASEDAAANQQKLRELADRAESAAHRTQASSEELMARTQAAVSTMLDQAQRLHKDAEDRASQVLRRAEAIREAIEQAHGEHRSTSEEVRQAREDAINAVQRVTLARQAAESSCADVLTRIEAARGAAETLMAMPGKIVAEAGEKAAALSELSEKLSALVRRISELGYQAEEQQRALERGGAEADRQVTTLREHTQRVGQLVGIIRQLYGAMDARVERMRERLTLADEMCRIVPREIDVLRDAVGGGASPIGRIPGADGAARRTTTLPSRPAASPTSQSSGSTVSFRSARGPRPGEKAGTSLGEIAARNQKLNAWLQGVLSTQTVPIAITNKHEHSDTPLQSA